MLRGHSGRTLDRRQRHGRFCQRLSRLLHGSEGGGDWRQALLQTDWREFASHLLAHLNDRKNEPPWLVLVDELPIFSFGSA